MAYEPTDAQLRREWMGRHADASTSAPLQALRKDLQDRHNRRTMIHQLVGALIVGAAIGTAIGAVITIL